MDRNEPALVVLDWDGVVSDTHAFMQAMFGELAALGITHETVEMLCRQARDRNGWNNVLLAEAIGASTSVSREQAHEAIQGILRRTPEFLYKDALDFIEAARDKRREIVVLTAGDERLQMEKLQHSKLREYFRDVHIVPVEGTAANKAQVLSSLLEQHKNVIFFDDKLTTIVHMHENLNGRGLFPVWVHRPGLGASDETSKYEVSELSWANIVQLEEKV